MIASRQELIVGSNVPMISQKQWESSCKSANGRNTEEPPISLITYGEMQNQTTVNPQKLVRLSFPTLVFLVRLSFGVLCKL